MSQILKSALSKILIVPVRFYQYAISPFTPAACRHVPSCSEYSVQALKMHGPGKGGLMALNRIGRCQPWGTSGYDPVPRFIIKKLNTKKYMSKQEHAPYYDLLRAKSFLLFLPLLFLMISCGQQQAKSDQTKNPKVLVSILPYKYFVEKIGGDFIETIVLIPPGVTPHIYDPSPRQMAEISKVDIYFYNGDLAFEQAWITKMKDSYSKLEISCLNDGIDLIAGEECKEEDEGHHHAHHHGVDPHTWLSAQNGKIIAEHIYRVLSEKYPEQSEFFKDNYEDFTSEIDILNFEINGALADVNTRKFMIFHPSLSYFARDYNMEQIPLEIDGKEPSPFQLKSSIDIARREGIRVVLIQVEFDMENAKIIADEIGGSLVQIDPLSENWATNLLEIAEKIKRSTQ